MRKPEVSIIMATYNRAHFIPKALESIKSQTFNDWECLIIDDGSNDNTEEIVKDFISVDPRFSFFKRTSNYKKGLPGSRNQGLDKAAGDYIIFFDDDDVVHPQNLEICLKTLHNKGGSFCRFNKKPFFSSFDEKEFEVFKYSDISPKKFTSANIEEMIIGKIPFASCTVMWKNESIGNLRFDENLSYAEEWEFYTRLLLQDIQGYSINSVLYYNRKHPASNTGEYYNKDINRIRAKVNASKKIISQLNSQQYQSPSLSHYFIRLSFFLRDRSLLNHTLKYFNYSTFHILKYRLGFIFYDIVRPFFILKSKLSRNQ